MGYAWIVIFFIVGLLYGLVSGRGAWVWVLVPLAFMFVSWFVEGVSTYNVVVPIISMITSALGVALGHLIALRRVEEA